MVKINKLKQKNAPLLLESFFPYEIKTKAADQQLSEKFFECSELFKKYETKGELLNPTVSHVMGIVFGKLRDMQLEVHDEVQDLTKSVESKVLKPLNDYQVRLISPIAVFLSIH